MNPTTKAPRGAFVVSGRGRGGDQGLAGAPSHWSSMAWIIVAGVSCRVMRPRSTWRCSDKRATCHDLGPEFGDVIVAKPAVEGVEQQHVLAIEAVVLDEGPDRRRGVVQSRRRAEPDASDGVWPRVCGVIVGAPGSLFSALASLSAWARPFTPSG